MAIQAALIRALVALAPACMLFSGSVVLFFKGKTVCSFLQLLGAGCLMVVVLTHVTEALHLLPSMHWGVEHSAGHYVDLWSAVLGLTLFPAGYLFCKISGDSILHFLFLPFCQPPFLRRRVVPVSRSSRLRKSLDPKGRPVRKCSS